MNRLRSGPAVKADALGVSRHVEHTRPTRWNGYPIAVPEKLVGADLLVLFGKPGLGKTSLLNARFPAPEMQEVTSEISPGVDLDQQIGNFDARKQCTSLTHQIHSFLGKGVFEHFDLESPFDDENVW